MKRESYETVESLFSEVLGFLDRDDLRKACVAVQYYVDVGEYGLAFEAALDGCLEWDQAIPDETREVLEKLARVMEMDVSMLNVLIKE